MVSVSTHVLDGAGGGPRAGVAVALEDLDGMPVGAATTDAAGRAAQVATGLAPGRYRLRWMLDGFLREVAVVVDLAEDRHYHLPLLASGASAVSYLGV